MAYSDMCSAFSNKIKMSMDDGAFMPLRGHDVDAGLDLRCMEEFTIRTDQTVKVNTGLHFDIPRGYMGLVLSKSGLYANHGIKAVGVVDPGYSGPVYVTMTKHGVDYDATTFKPGDKIAQMVVVPFMTYAIELVGSVEGGERGDNGFGSTGR